MKIDKDLLVKRIDESKAYDRLRNYYCLVHKTDTFILKKQITYNVELTLREFGILFDNEKITYNLALYIHTFLKVGVK